MLLQNISEYLESLEIERGLSENTIQAYRRDLYYFADFLQSYNIDSSKDVKRNHINYYIKNLYDNKYTPASITRKIASLRGFFKWMFANEKISQDPSLGIEQPKLSKRLPKVISPAEIEDILQNHLNDTEKVIMELLYGAGLRVSELVNLKVSDIDLNAKYLRCFGKGSKERIIPIGDKAKHAIKV